MGRGRIKLCAVRPIQTGTVARDLNHRTLHAEADSEVRNLILPGILDGADLSFDPPRPKTSWNEHAIDSLQKTVRSFLLDLLGVDILQIHSGVIRNAPVDQSLGQTLVGLHEAHVFSYDGDRGLMMRSLDFLDHLLPLFQVGPSGPNVQLLDESSHRDPLRGN